MTLETQQQVSLHQQRTPVKTTFT